MRSLKKFEEFKYEGIVQSQTSDIERAKSLISESKEKLEFYEKIKSKFEFEELSPNYVIETSYDVLIEILRSKLLSTGFKTESHEVEVSYMRNLGFSESDVLFMNQLRYFRNGIKYYGKIFDSDYAKMVDKFLYKCLKKLNL